MFERDDLEHPFGEQEEWQLVMAAPRVANALEQCEIFHEKGRFERCCASLREFIVQLVGEDVDGDGDVDQVQISSFILFSYLFFFFHFLSFCFFLFSF